MSEIFAAEGNGILLQWGSAFIRTAGGAAVRHRAGRRLLARADFWGKA